jgi:hypothetical protein
MTLYKHSNLHISVFISTCGLLLYNTPPEDLRNEFPDRLLNYYHSFPQVLNSYDGRRFELDYDLFVPARP